ncbi:uncharacterized protein LOC131255592 isoform X1 [Magnolia sinica]|uniref:uncharacterized protein LOC131255592 isoform X1 n=1 Tax=Magnolia sinica TaxID=86752 RepID=UPI0026585286|nr:uncharacterized protein LOC131255592 isoform X1 [Magnolia sinica]
MEEEEDDLPFDSNASQVIKRFPLRGMESVIATVSGYHGLEKFKLIKLITQTGASYVGTMSKSTTHLVCWQFEGRKYSLAKDLGTNIVNHLWFENCMKEGKRLPEGPYTMQSGKQVGPLLWKATTVVHAPGKKGRLLIGKEKRVLTDRSNALDDTNTREIDTRYLDVGCSAWVDSHLLRQPDESSSYTLLSSRHKRNVLTSGGSSTSAEPVSRRRRPVKKNAFNELLDSSVLYCEQEPSEIDISNRLHNVSGALNDSSNGNALPPNITTSGNSSNNFEENRSTSPEEVEDIGDLPHNLGNGNNNAVPPRETTSQNGVCDADENKDGKMKGDNDLAEGIGFPMAMELSCVICWTDFSSTRGVLPCGHRFCYSCIQSWADQMASRRKVSTCPLCKASFVSITKVEGAACSDQKIYSQTLPCTTSSTDILMLADREFCNSDGFQPPPSVCYECRNREPEDLLLSCLVCRNQWVHSYCLDPPLFPWTCIHCRDHRTLYQRFRL